LISVFFFKWQKVTFEHALQVSSWHPQTNHCIWR